MSTFDAVVQRSPDVPSLAVIHLRGEIDMGVSQALREHLERVITPSTRHVLFVLTGVSFIDSHNIGAFVGVYQKLKAANGWIGIMGSQPYVRRVFEIMNLDKLFRLFGQWSEVVDALRADGIVSETAEVASLVDTPPFASSASE